LPLGLTNPTRESEWHQILGNFGHLKTAHEDCSFPNEFNSSMFANFSISTNPRLRLPLAKFLQSRNVSFSEPVFSSFGRINYLKQLREHSLAICPEGNGVDTHRLWETLYMGGTPVITKSNMLSNLVKDLPVIVLSDWSELEDMARLEKEWHGLQLKKMHFDKLRASFWLGQVCLESN
jgi:hypothetical protein